MTLTVLFDLDHTLLQTNIDDFIPEYFVALGDALSHHAPQRKIIDQIRYAVHQMTKNQNPGQMLEEVFAENFYAPLGIDKQTSSDDEKPEPRADAGRGLRRTFLCTFGH